MTKLENRIEIIIAGIILKLKAGENAIRGGYFKKRETQRRDERIKRKRMRYIDKPYE